MQRSCCRDLAQAAARGNLQRVTELLEGGADPNEENEFGRTPLQVMQISNTAIARLLVAKGGDPNRCDPDTGTCPAHDAAREGFLDTLLVLLSAGADLYSPLDNFGKRPIDLATEEVTAGLAEKGLITDTRLPRLTGHALT